MSLKQDIGLPCLNCQKCTGFKIHGWRKICTECLCSVEDHDISDESALPILDEMKLFEKSFSNSYQEALNLAEKLNKSWLPIGLKYNEVPEFCSLMPESLDKSIGDKARKKKIRLQIPVQDRCVEKFCHLDTTIERQEAEKFLSHRNSRDIGMGYIIRSTEENNCSNCGLIILNQSLCVTADINCSNSSGNNNHKSIWHPACFKCHKCEELLVDFFYGHSSINNNSHNNTNPSNSTKLFCIRHYAATLRPRCFACDELIFSSELVKNFDTVANQTYEYHANHFACGFCDQSLAKKRYLSVDTNENNISQRRPICISCYDQKIASKCCKCSLPITCEVKRVTYRNQHWHVDCFNCCVCSVNLEQLEFGSVGDQLYCESCHLEKNAHKCQLCTRPIEYGKKMVNFIDRNWHYECFICCECKNPIGSENFVQHNDKMVCNNCYDKVFAKTCDTCKLPIKEGGVTYKDVNFHYSCFCCSNCNAKIADIKFTVNESKFYCKVCTDELFANKCTKCSKLITGDTSLKYVKFQEHYWHNTCFNCTKCNGNLVDKGFTMKGDEIICVQCAS